MKEPEKFSLVICDHQPVFTQALAHLVATECDDFEVVGLASDGEEADRLAYQLFPDVVLMNIHLPGPSGIEVSRRIRDRCPNIKVIMLTDSEDDADLYEALRSGACGYLTKGQGLPEIASAIRSVLNGYVVIPAFLASNVLADLEKSDPMGLSEAERQILDAIAGGRTNRQIARSLHMSERTLRRRLQDIYSKLHVADRLEAAAMAGGGAGARKETKGTG